LLHCEITEDLIGLIQIEQARFIRSFLFVDKNVSYLSELHFLLERSGTDPVRQ